jgi:hypothetical protein
VSSTQPDHGLTVALAKKICESLPLYPTRELACAACGIGIKTVENLVRRGQQAGADWLLKAFSSQFLLAEAEMAREQFEMYQKLLAQGDGRSAKIAMDYIDRRWKIGASSDVLGAVGDAAKRTDDLHAMLMHPTPRLRAILRETGWSRPADWHSEPKQLTAGNEED